MRAVTSMGASRARTCAWRACVGMRLWTRGGALGRALGPAGVCPGIAGRNSEGVDGPVHEVEPRVEDHPKGAELGRVDVAPLISAWVTCAPRTAPYTPTRAVHNQGGSSAMLKL